MRKKSFLPLALCVVLGIASCKKELIPGTYESAPTSIGNGQLTAWATFNKAGEPTAIGLSLTDGALEGLSQDTSHHSGNFPHNIFEAQLPPEIVTKTPFQHVAVNWNPAGHTAPVYSKQHFDFHFYMTSSAERKMIPTYEQDSAKFKNVPAAEYMPPTYFKAPGGEPEMGCHWIPNDAPELTNPPAWNETFVYGSYDGEVNFYEPMVTYVFLKNTTEYTRSIPWPAKVQKSGFYPKLMRIRHADGRYTISLEQFEHRTAS